MKNKIMQLGLILGLAIGLTVTAQAQTASQYRVNIPFDFTVGGKTLPAGEYSVKVGGLMMNNDTLLIRSVEGDDAILMAIGREQRINRSATAVVSFRVYGDSYVLSEIVTRDFGIKVKGGKRPKGKLAKNYKRVDVAMSK